MTTPPEPSAETAAPRHSPEDETPQTKPEGSKDAASQVKPGEQKDIALHIKLEEPEDAQDHSHDAESGQGLRNDKGWDGKLRVDRVALANPDAISDPEYSDDENVLQGEVIGADEGAPPLPYPLRRGPRSVVQTRKSVV